MRSRQCRDATHRNEGRGRDPQMEAGDAVFVKSARAEPLSWEEAVLVHRVSDSMFVVKVGEHSRFMHIKQLSPSWTSVSNTSLHPDIAKAPPESTPGARNQDFPSSLSGDAPPGDFMVSDATAGQLEDVRLDDAASTEQPASQPEAEHSTAEPSSILNSTTASPEGAPLRSNRTRRPPNRYQASDYDRGKKRVYL
ncbi:hypothetical protein HPB50_012151 [Hyalomma asiaticum]|uniref:Uncharacterized protein n=1 Tax=Hyalomma asiaticum TaxID=266040 RepID=A0ACB7SD62_HYAAI|nr:hypothetical protein HPB50_012151 [Hyalomma asiaticum]